MQNMLRTLSNEIVFWMAWVIIPIVVEIVPAFLSILMLLLKRLRIKKDKELTYFPEITLIIPVYNSGKTLKACLDSVDTSGYPNSFIDIMLVDNGSVDNSYEIFQDYQKNHPDMNMTWMNAKQGKSRALNMALFNSDGKYILHIDSDGTLHPEAIMNVVRRFESNEKISCMTGAVLTNPNTISEEKNLFRKILMKTEFFEYAKAFLAGRNYEAEVNSIFTLSGAFSAFRKSTILKTQLYNTDTVCEDTHVTFQIRYLLRRRIDICENAIFYVEPTDSIGTLYVQRQRWQRGEIEVIHMFRQKQKKHFVLFDLITRVLLFDHTFAFPRMIWYFALLCLSFIGYPFRYILISTLLVYFLYVISALLDYINICFFLTWDKKLFRYYTKKVLYAFLLPILNFIIYWFRFAGIINSIKGASSWRTSSFQEELKIAGEMIKKDFSGMFRLLQKIRGFLYENDDSSEKGMRK